MKRALAAVLLSSLVGCTSIHNLSHGDPQIYGGVRTYPAAFQEMGYKTQGIEGIIHGPILWCAAWFEIPMSFVMDTLLLPITVPVSIFRGPEAP